MFLYVTQKHFSSFSYWKIFGESVSLLVHFVFFTLFLYFLMTKLVYLIQKTTSLFLSHVFMEVKSNLFLCLLFLPYIPIIVYHSYLFLDFMPKHLDRHSRTIYEANLFNKKFKNFNKDLTFLKCSVELDFEFNVTVDSCMYTNFYVVDFYNLAQFTRLNVFKALNPASASINISLEPHFLWCFFSQCFVMYF